MLDSTHLFNPCIVRKHSIRLFYEIFSETNKYVGILETNSATTFCYFLKPPHQRINAFQFRCDGHVLWQALICTALDYEIPLQPSKQKRKRKKEEKKNCSFYYFLAKESREGGFFLYKFGRNLGGKDNWK